MNTRFHPIILFTVLLSLLIAVSLAFDLLPILRGGEIFSWLWGYFPVPLVYTGIFAALVLVYLLAGYWHVRRERALWSITWGMIGAAVIPVLVVALRYDDPLLELWLRTMSPITTGPHTAAAMIDWRTAEWHVWTDMMREYQPISGHVGLSPAGLPMIYAGLNTLFGWLPNLSERLQEQMMPYQCHNYTFLQYTPNEWASSAVGAMMPVWAALSALPLFAVMRRLHGDIAARWGVIWWAMVPSFVMFAPSWNTFYPLLALIAFWWLLIGIGGYPRRIPALIGCGFLSALLIFLNLSMVPLIGLFGFYTLLHFLLNERDVAHWTKPMIVGAWVGVGFFGLWIAYYLFSGLTPLDIIHVAFEYHFVLERDYLPAVWFHFWEWALLAGIPFILLWLFASLRREAKGDVLGLALLATMLVLLFSNTARGETGRVWLFFAAFALIAAGGGLARLMRQSDDETALPALHRHALLIGIVQAALLTALASTWDVMGVPDLRPPPETPAVAVTHNGAGINVNHEFALYGWRAEVDDNRILLDLGWVSQSQMTTPYWFSALLVAPDGSPVGESVVWQPQETRFPTTCWLPGDTIGDEIILRLPADTAAGDWWLSITAFPDAENPAETLPVYLPDGSTDRQIGLGPIPVDQVASSKTGKVP